MDSLQYPVNFRKYFYTLLTDGAPRLQELALRGSGPLPALPWGTPNLTVGLERRLSETPQRVQEFAYPITVLNSYRQTYFPRDATTDSGYAELSVPLLKSAWLTGVHTLEFQLAGRYERYEVDSGTSYGLSFYNRTPVTTSYLAPTLNGQPYFTTTTYNSSNYTMGLKYQPLAEVTLRASMATAFLPPTPGQLIKNPVQSTTTTAISDPVTGQTGVPVYTLSGGNPDLTPQGSKSFNAGAIWTPTWALLKGLRFNAEYYRIEQDNYIATLTAQQMVTFEKSFPGRVTRNAAGTITLVDISSANLYKRETEGWDLSADYTRKTGIGAFNVGVVGTVIQHLKNQYSLTVPENDAVHFPSEGGAAKYKGSVSLGWESRNWTAGWSARYFGDYKQQGAAGGPSATQRAATGTTDAGRLPSTTYTLPQGGNTIPSQIYHDLFVGYAFGDKQKTESLSRLSKFGSKLLSGVTVQLGVRNVFDKIPPFDVYYSTNYYLSPYGDTRLRSYWLTLKKAF